MKAVKTLLKGLFGLYGFVLLIGLWAGHKNASPTTTSAATPERVAQATTTTAERPAPEPPQRATTVRNSRTHAVKVDSWGQNALPIIYAIKGNLETTSEAATNMELPAMVQGCVALRRNVGRLRDELPAPDEELDAELSAVVKNFMAAANHCIRGGSSLDADELQAASNNMTAGTRHVLQASERIKELTRDIR